MDWFVLAVLDAFFAALVAIFAKVGLQGVDSNVATAVRAIVMTVFMVGFVIAMGKGPQLTQLTSKDMIFIVLSGVAGAKPSTCRWSMKAFRVFRATLVFSSLGLRKSSSTSDRKPATSKPCLARNS